MKLSKMSHFVLEKSVVLEVIFYESTEDLVSANLSSESPLIICPSPIVADGLRRLMPENLEIITISKWVTDYLKTKNLKRSNKAELMLRLSSVWRHYFPKEEAHLFFKSFEMFTDLRSFSLNLELLSEFLKELDEVTTKSILLFWTFLQNEQIIDEHLSYQVISECEIEKPIWIMGFKHLSGIQIDMLKVISEKTDVKVFFPKDVYVESLSTDWIRWLVPEEKIEITNEVKTLKVIHFPKNKLNIVLNSIKKMIPVFDLALASSNLTLNARQEVSLESLFFKSPEDLFKMRREELIEALNEELIIGPASLEDFSIKIEERKIKALDSEDFIYYKVLSLLSEALELYGEFQASVDTFTLKIFKMILELNSPRISLATITSNPETRLLELNELPYKKSEHPLVMVASSNYGTLKSQEGKYSEKMIEALKIIAPIKRSGLDFSYLKSELIQILSNNKNILLLEEGLEVIDLAWREILKGFELEIVNPKADYKLKIKQDYLLPLIKPGPYTPKNISASRLQVFMDCPRKYYFSYVEKIDHRPTERLKIAADEMGTIEHEIIEQYFIGRKIDSSLIFEPKLHEELCVKALDGFISSHKIILNEKTKLTTFYELLHYTQNGIEFLINFCHENRADGIKFEHSLGENPWKLVGSIDCLVFLENDKIALFDFKRSGAAIGSKRDTMAFDKIQIWAYLIVVQRFQEKQIHTWGYLNLSEIEASQIYNESESLVMSTDKMDDFQICLEKVIEEMKAEVQFRAVPRTNKVCDFCEVQLFCSKGSCVE
ncbi:MAG: PD-(D/E)XK nuclease family protein [Bacteriovorax sp.]|nr:PD-(D/E)XK nuclease family protein [Bacteriovorax sp.]